MAERRSLLNENPWAISCHRLGSHGQRLRGRLFAVRVVCRVAVQCMVSACATVGVAWPLHVVFHVIVAMVIACATGCILFAGPLQYLVCLDSTDLSGESG